MPKTAKKIALAVAAFIVVVFAIFLFNQTMQIVQSARGVNVVFGNGVMWGLIFTYCILLTTPLWLWFRLPKRMLPPETTEGAAYDRFLVDFKKRLSRHPRLRGHALDSQTDIENALQKLDKHADDVVTSTASAVFLSTAVLQSGRLDVLVVFAAQTRTNRRTAVQGRLPRESLRRYLADLGWCLPSAAHRRAWAAGAGACRTVSLC